MKEALVRLVGKFGDMQVEILEGTMVEGDFLIYEDPFGKKWKLVPNTNERIRQPFLITPYDLQSDKVYTSVELPKTTGMPVNSEGAKNE